MLENVGSKLLPTPELHFGRRLLLIHELAGRLVLGPGLLTLQFGRELRSFLHRALAGVVADRLVDGHHGLFV
jgi:hypothetical protein